MEHLKVAPSADPGDVMFAAAELFKRALALRRQTRDRALEGRASPEEFGKAAELTYQCGVQLLRSAMESELEATFPTRPHGSDEDAWVARWQAAQVRTFARLKALGAEVPDVPPLPDVRYSLHPDRDLIAGAVASVITTTGRLMADPLL